MKEGRKLLLLRIAGGEKILMVLTFSRERFKNMLEIYLECQPEMVSDSSPWIRSGSSTR